MQEAPDRAKMREFLAAQVDPDGLRTVLDLGCGRGADLDLLARRLPAASRLIGLDNSPSAIEAARAAARDDRLEFIEGDAAKELPYANGEIDLVYSVNFLECVEDKQSALAEIARVLRPAGQIICGHFDWDSIAINGLNKALTRKVVHAYADWRQAWMADSDGWMGRRLWAEFGRSGRYKGRIESYVLTNADYCEPFYGHGYVQGCAGLVRNGKISEDEYDAFVHGLQRLADKGEYFFGATMYAYVGTKV